MEIPGKLDALRSTDSDVQSDDLSPPAKHKAVAIDTSQNKHFNRKLLPVQSPEFDNVIDQVKNFRFCLCLAFDHKSLRLGLIDRSFRLKA